MPDIEPKVTPSVAHTDPDLTEWLLEQIAEDERLGYDAIGQDEDEARAPFTPKRVYAECQAKRQVVNAWQALTDFAYEAKTPEEMNNHDAYVMRMATAGSLEGILLLLASVYSDRDGYQEEWRI